MGFFFLGLDDFRKLKCFPSRSQVSGRRSPPTSNTIPHSLGIEPHALHHLDHRLEQYSHNGRAASLWEQSRAFRTLFAFRLLARRLFVRKLGSIGIPLWHLHRNRVQHLPAHATPRLRSIRRVSWPITYPEKWTLQTQALGHSMAWSTSQNSPPGAGQDP